MVMSPERIRGRESRTLFDMKVQLENYQKKMNSGN